MTRLPAPMGPAGELPPPPRSGGRGVPPSPRRGYRDEPPPHRGSRRHNPSPQGQTAAVGRRCPARRGQVAAAAAIQPGEEECRSRRSHPLHPRRTHVPSPTPTCRAPAAAATPSQRRRPIGKAHRPFASLPKRRGESPAAAFLGARTVGRQRLLGRR
jgi:hypothetical protein